MPKCKGNNMSGLEMKYFVLKPRARGNNDHYAHASREAIKAYAETIESIDPELARDVRAWRIAERNRMTDIMRGIKYNEI